MSPEKKKVAWLVPNLLEGSGGHRTMFQNMQALIDCGYQVDAYIEYPKPAEAIRPRDVESVRRTVHDYFGATEAGIRLTYDVREPYDVVFASVWHSAKVVSDLKQPCKKAYFVQDFEACFMPMGDGYLIAENSYRLGLTPVTIGRWLAAKMREDFSQPAAYFDFCADKSVYFPDPAVKRKKAVCFVFQPEKPRRCVTIGVEALGIVKHHAPDTEIILYGSNDKAGLWFEHTHMGLLPLEKCNELYNRCAVGFCISSSNPSRVPFEMMAAGLPVVDLYRENNFYDLPEDGVLLADQTPEALAKAILTILEEDDRREAMSQAAVQFMRDRDLSVGYRQFVAAVDRIVDGRPVAGDPVQKIYRRKAVVADFGYSVTPRIRLSEPGPSRSPLAMARRAARLGVKAARYVLTGRK
jgi:glycosyltransferase involved in cell wall biosynthesis